MRPERQTRRMTVPTQRLEPTKLQSRSENSEAGLAHLAALERLNTIITAFASMVSHETRTALVGIQGMSELIRDGDLDQDEIRGYAADIFSEAEKINALIGEMFDLNRLETGQITFRKANVDVNQIAGEVVDQFRNKAARHSIEFDAQADRPMVIGDPDRLRQAIQNVLSFCVRAAKVESHIAVATANEPGFLRLGISSSTLKLVDFDDWLYGRYERYEQRPSAIIGAGLGLAVARAIVELHAGRVGVESKPRSGSEFVLTLPGS